MNRNDPVICLLRLLRLKNNLSVTLSLPALVPSHHCIQQLIPLYSATAKQYWETFNFVCVAPVVPSSRLASAGWQCFCWALAQPHMKQWTQLDWTATPGLHTECVSKKD